MKRTVIEYKAIGDKIIIVRIENAANDSKVRHVLGLAGFAEYTTGDYYVQCSGGIFVRDGANKIVYDARPGSTMSKSAFGSMISGMKKGGARFTMIKKGEGVPTKTILI